ncbi:NAD(+) synthase [Candidatus Oleimmundimicrobium sp.]|uniref:NAD(+) synthase n=1 Tax=Candidatus Oleimmundimicrobium sp. TaxID=3060597 RepID=UPI00271E23EE|nr:NAD(+) synthase [Candidatus Oleimmundimicrobium sp.]MDO8886662.1 NAD(+) synthase [Candidatus Oleimmundimicrobium sp.]
MEAGKVSKKIDEWIKDKVALAEAKGVVFGLSGGLDSATIALLCKNAFSDNTLALIMPCGSRKEDTEEAVSFAKKFDINYRLIELDESYNKLVGEFKKTQLKESLDHNRKRLALANIKPRLRMTTLYYFANLFDYLVVGTSNKSEWMIGYFTKYGDGGADIVPLGNLLKTEVRELAVYLGVSQEIIDKPPSAGLWEEQTDEEEIGITYNELDACLSGQKSIEKVDLMIKRSEHKRALPDMPDFK